jgi:hypothetical protein
MVYANILVVNDLYWPDPNMRPYTENPPSSGPIQEHSETCAKARLSRYYRHAEPAVPEVDLTVKVRFAGFHVAMSAGST